MKKRMIRLLALTLVAIMTFFAVGCDMDAIFAPLTEIQPDVPSGEWDSPDDTTLVTDDEDSYLYLKPSWNYFPDLSGDGLDFEGGELVILLPDTKEAHQS